MSDEQVYITAHDVMEYYGCTRTVAMRLLSSLAALGKGYAYGQGRSPRGKPSTLYRMDKCITLHMPEPDTTPDRG